MTGPYPYTEDDFPPSPVPSPPPTPIQRLKKRAGQAKPFIPYVILGWGIKTRSTNALVTAVFSLIAVKAFNKHTTISNCSFTGGDVGVLVK